MPRDPTPAQRAAIHAAKMEARQMRRNQTPGPGSYETQRRPRPTGGGVASFKSQTKRLNMEEESLGDPGAYDPYAGRDLANTSRNSFSRSGKNGGGSFGSMSAREMKMDLRDTPGPGAYEQNQGQLFDKKPACPSSAFRSSSSQRMKGSVEDTPGVGSYNPKMSAVEPSFNAGVSGMRGKSNRFTVEASTTDTNVGPGAYAVENSGSIAQDVANAVLKSSRGNAGFGTRSAQHVLPIPAGAEEVPGPGTYEAPRSRSTDSKRPSSAFKSNTKRLAMEEDSMGDPGAYDPHAGTELAASTKSSFGRSGKSGAGSFGSSSARELKMQSAGQDTPGPGAYEKAETLGSARSCKTPSSAFRSSSSQRMKGSVEDTPGAGSYNPNMSAVEPSFNAGVSGMRGKVNRFKVEQSTTDPSVGPGTHTPLYDSRGNRATVSSMAQADRDMANTYGARRVQSAAFSSDVVRDLPY